MNFQQETPEYVSHESPFRSRDVASANQSFYREVMLWLLLCFAVTGFATYFIGPLIPPAAMMPLYIILLIAMIGSAFVRQTTKMSGILAILFSLGLGIILYPTLNYYVASGSGNIVLLALGGTAAVFGSAAVLGWRSSKSLESWSGKLFAILIGIIVVSLLNTFLFHMEFLYTLIAWVAVALFTVYTFIDIQRIRDRAGDRPASWYALNIFLDIYNIFVSLLQIFGGSRR